MCRRRLDAFYEGLNRFVALGRVSTEQRETLLQRLLLFEQCISSLTQVYTEISGNPLRAGMFAMREFVLRRLFRR